jgi:hypothetical protein
VPPSTDRTALAAGVAFLVLAASGLLATTGVAPHGWVWPVAALVVLAAGAVAVRTAQAVLAPPADEPAVAPPAADE